MLSLSKITSKYARPPFTGRPATCAARPSFANPSLRLGSLVGRVDSVELQPFRAQRKLMQQSDILLSSLEPREVTVRPLCTYTERLYYHCTNSLRERTCQATVSRTSTGHMLEFISQTILVTTDLHSISTIPTTSDDEPAARRNRPYDYSPYDDDDSVLREPIPKTETSQVDSSRIQYTPLINDTTLPVHPQYESLSRFPARSAVESSSSEFIQPRLPTPAAPVNQRQPSVNEYGYASMTQSRYSPSQPPQVVTEQFTPIRVPEIVPDVARNSQDTGRRTLGTVELDARDTHDIFKQ